MFSQYACWKPEMIRNVMDVVATHPENHIFLATHHPTKMYRQNLGEAQSRISYDEESFLHDFLETPDFSFVPVLGTAGTGKSHLIRWLYTRINAIKKKPKCRVLLIPKFGTNLRDILEKILDGLDGSEFDEYRNRLRQATHTIAEGEVREQLLANLAIAVGLSGNRTSDALSDVEHEIATGLPNLLRDPFFTEEFWLKSGGIIDRLVMHILGNQNTIEDVEERRGFSIEDLPEGARHILKASEKARDFYNNLVSDLIPRDKVVEWLNKHLDEAIAKVLNLGREDLQRLMLDVRRTLAKRDIELILLIEDFAKLQGIDREVLEAVIARSQSGEEPLCAMRTALACTEGYFKGLFDTVRTRVDFSVNLDVETVGEQSLVTQTDVQQLAARYLNAVRLEDKEIREWLEDSDEPTGRVHNSVPIACENCDYRVECHAGFGQVNGMGLYPFNAIAIERMLSSRNKGVFNPRILIKEVLRHILEYHRPAIEQGYFPSRLLLEQFSGYVLDPIALNTIKNRDTAENADRRETLLKLWTNSKQACDLPMQVHTAFSLLPLGIQVDVQKDSKATTVNLVSDITTTFKSLTPSSLIASEDRQSDEMPNELAEKLQALDRWSNGSELDSKVASKLRLSIFSAIKVRIDWDAELLLKGQFIDTTSGFISQNINFQKATTSKLNIRGIELPLPLREDELGKTAIALKAILLYEEYQHWRFPQGATYFRSYASKLEEWSNFVLKKIPQCTTKSKKSGNPIPATIELLAIAGRMAGRSTDSPEERVNAIFADLEKVEIRDRASSWQKLFNSLKKNQPKLEEILKTRLACTKGGATKLQIIDAAQIMAPLNAIAKDWQPKIDISDISSDLPFNAISDARSSVDNLLEQAIRDERDRHLEIYNQVVNEFGEDFLGNKENKDRMLEALSQAILKAKEAGVAAGKLTELENAIREFKRIGIEDYIKTLKEISRIDDTGVLLKKLSQLSQKPVDAIANFISVAKQCLSASTQRAESSLNSLKEAEGEDLSSCYSQIEISLIVIQNAASEIKGEPLC